MATSYFSHTNILFLPIFGFDTCADKSEKGVHMLKVLKPHVLEKLLSG